MNQKRTILFFSCLLAAANAQTAAATMIDVTRTTTTAINAGPATFSIDVPLSPPVASADQLVSFSAGSFSDDSEGGTFTISVKFDTLATDVVYSTPGNGTPVPFTGLSDLAFPSGNVTDLVFAYNSFADQLLIPAGTVITLQAAAPGVPVPEPISLALLGTGMIGLLTARRMRPTT